jgi:MFS family permease
MNPTRVRFGVLAFACSLSLITYLDRVCISRVKESISDDLGIGNKEIGAIFSAFLLGYMIFEVPGGWLGDRWGSRRVLTRIVLWWSVFTALTGCVWQFHLDYYIPVDLLGMSFTITLLFNSFWLMLLIRFLFGCGEAGAYPNLARVVGSWFPFRERAFAQGAIWMSARMGGAIAPVVIGRLSDWIGWRQAFWIFGLIGLAWVAMFRLWYRDRPEDHPGCSPAERDLIRSGPHSMTEAEAAHGHGSIPWRTMLTSVNLWAVCLAGFSVSFGWYFYPTWQPEFLKDVHKIDYRDSELLTGLPFFFGACGCLLGGSISDWLVRRTGSRRWGRSILGLVGFTGAGICVGATPYVAEPWQAVALLCLAFFINDLAIPVIWAVGTDIGGRHAGSVSGFMNMIGAVGGMISPYLTGVLIEDLPADWPKLMRWQVVFWVMTSAWAVAALAWLRIDASKPLFRDSQH